MIKISGGPLSKDIRIYFVSADGVQTEITHDVRSLEINVPFRGVVTAEIEFINIELELGIFGGTKNDPRK